MNDGGIPARRPGPVVGDLGRLAVDERRGPDDRRPERGRQRLHPQAHPEQRDAVLRGHADRRHRDARRPPGRPGPGEMTIPRRSAAGIVGQGLDAGPVDRVVAQDRTSAPAAWRAWTRLNVKLS